MKRRALCYFFIFLAGFVTYPAIVMAYVAWVWMKSQY
jgi:hypothetical protein